MTTLAVDTPRSYGVNMDPVNNDLPVIASDIIFEGAAVGDDGNGFAQPLAAADPFLGFARSQADNASGSAGDINVSIRQRGTVELAVTGVTSVDDVNETVYAADDDDFTLTSTSNTPIGKVIRWITSTTCMVAFEAVALRSA